MAARELALRNTDVCLAVTVTLWPAIGSHFWSYCSSASRHGASGKGDSHLVWWRWLRLAQWAGGERERQRINLKWSLNFLGGGGRGRHYLSVTRHPCLIFSLQPLLSSLWRNKWWVWLICRPWQWGLGMHGDVTYKAKVTPVILFCTSHWQLPNLKGRIVLPNRPDGLTGVLSYFSDGQCMHLIGMI